MEHGAVENRSDLRAAPGATDPLPAAPQTPAHPAAHPTRTPGPDTAAAPGHIGTGWAHAKIILFGEHAVVHGQPAIAFPLRKIGLQATAAPVPGPLRLTVDIYDGPLAHAPARLGSLVTTIESTLDLLHHPLEGVRVTCLGDVPLERGLGSSAAGASSIVNALADLMGTELDERTRYELVQTGERVAHGSPSGLDAYTVVTQRPIWFQAGRVEDLEVALSAPLVVADSGRPGDTHSAVAAVGEIRRSDPELAADYFETIRHHTVAARADLAADRAASLGAHMDAVHETLQILSVSCEELDHLVGTARAAGAHGAKLTGGGRGGCIIALARDRGHAPQLARALEEAGAAQTWIIDPEEFTA
ncbi:mevalonate kinase [Rothia kristinae]|uniref:mevalonate kinase n=1 Tax=Rothia kristinae TaxID=37923 RepID=UPI0033CE046D